MVGNGNESDLLEVMAAVIPEAPATPTISEATKTIITIDWTAPYNGGTPLTNYIIQWNSGNSVAVFDDLTTVDANTLSFTKTGLTTGEIYQWKIIAVNAIGQGPESEHVEVMAAIIPEAAEAPTSSFADETCINIEWAAPHDGGTPLTNYIV